MRRGGAKRPAAGGSSPERAPDRPAAPSKRRRPSNAAPAAGGAAVEPPGPTQAAGTAGAGEVDGPIEPVEEDAFGTEAGAEPDKVEGTSATPVYAAMTRIMASVRAVLAGGRSSPERRASRAMLVIFGPVVLPEIRDALTLYLSEPDWSGFVIRPPMRRRRAVSEDCKRMYAERVRVYTADGVPNSNVVLSHFDELTILDTFGDAAIRDGESQDGKARHLAAIDKAVMPCISTTRMWNGGFRTQCCQLPAAYDSRDLAADIAGKILLFGFDSALLAGKEAVAPVSNQRLFDFVFDSHTSLVDVHGPHVCTFSTEEGRIVVQWVPIKATNTPVWFAAFRTPMTLDGEAVVCSAIWDVSPGTKPGRHIVVVLHQGTRYVLRADLWDDVYELIWQASGARGTQLLGLPGSHFIFLLEPGSQGAIRSLHLQTRRVEVLTTRRRTGDILFLGQQTTLPQDFPGKFQLDMAKRCLVVEQGGGDSLHYLPLPARFFPAPACAAACHCALAPPAANSPPSPTAPVAVPPRPPHRRPRAAHSRPRAPAAPRD